ncbi:MAG TPA: ABC transporter permease subunit [Candidatus Eremiobacteraceae bacterium]|nr:ABC transporter permease subunit [Candidatus Eremiobacteraceae bacterium]
MSQVWERLFVFATRFFAWAIAAVPVAAVLVLVAALIVAQRASAGDVARMLLSQLAITVFVALLATAVGATVGMGCAIFSHELARGRLARIIRLHAKFLAAVPAVAIGWFGVAVLLPAGALDSTAWVLGAVAAAVAIAVLPDGYILTVRAVRAVPAELLEAAAALGASSSQATTQVILPGSLRRFAGIYAAVFSRALPEATAASILFLTGARAGFAPAHFSLGATLLAGATAGRPVDVSLPMAALLLLVLTLAVRAIAARRIGELEWV